MTLYLLTAPSGAGKTTFCAALAEQARAAGWDVAGVLCPPIFENGVKTGILAQNLRTRATRHLAALANQSPITNYQPQITNYQSPISNYQLPLGQWLFDASVMDWSNEIFASSLPCDLFIVDELGPLELMRGEGWMNALTALRQGTYKIGVAVVRPSLLEAAQKLFPESQVLTLPQSASEFFLFVQEV
ncbi:MAG: nucleoside-triphosphatase [Chloroflexota bacterium]